MFSKILVPLDGSPIAEQAIPVAVSLARAARAPIDLIRVHQPLKALGVSGSEQLDRAEWRDDERYLEAIVAETRATAGVPVTSAVPAGNAVDLICTRALDERADLIVMTSHGRTGLSRAWLGSVADGVIRRSGIPVLMLRAVDSDLRRAREGVHFRRILVPLDGSRAAAEVLEPAVALAQANGATLVLLRVVQPVPMSTVTPMGFASVPAVEDEEATRFLEQEAKRELVATAGQIASRGGGITNVETQVLVAPGVARAILSFATRYDVGAIAMSTHGRGASRLLIGSIADKLLRGSALPILLRRPELPARDAELVTPGEIEQQLATVSGD